MSVLVKDVRMPKSCLMCPFEESPEFVSLCIAKDYKIIGKWEDLGGYKPDWCPLEEPKAEWIPVSDRLPDKEKCVLVTVWGDVGIAWIDKDGIWESDEYIYDGDEITAWMPLPEPYREDGDV